MSSSIPPVPIVIATHPPNPKGVGVLTFAPVTLRSLRGMFTSSTLRLSSLAARGCSRLAGLQQVSPAPMLSIPHREMTPSHT